MSCRSTMHTLQKLTHYFSLFPPHLACINQYLGRSVAIKQWTWLPTLSWLVITVSSHSLMKWRGHFCQFSEHVRKLMLFQTESKFMQCSPQQKLSLNLTIVIIPPTNRVYCSQQTDDLAVGLKLLQQFSSHLNETCYM